MKPPVLSKIAAQVSIYFQKAYEANQINVQLRSFEGGNFANVLGYHARYFEAQSWFQLARAAYIEADESCKGMPRAGGLLAMSASKFALAENHVKAIGGSYAANWQKKNAECNEMLAKCRKEL